MKDDIITEWFQSWHNSKWNNFQVIFESDIYYSESWGPEYYGIDELKLWVFNWHTNSRLNTWKIKKITHLTDRSFVEWYFSSSDSEGKYDFDGISIVEWGILNKIKSLKEFGSTLPKYKPI